MAVALDDLPERPISTHPNFVTPEGLGLIEHQLALAQHRLSQTRGDRQARAAIRRDIDYWTTRRATAQVVGRPEDMSRVRFGATVTVAEGGAQQSWRIVCEDEADAGTGTLAYVSPLAQALVGRRVGETVQAEGRDYTVVAIG